MHKYFGGRNTATFRPASLRDLSVDRAEHNAIYAPVADALGKFVRSNLRTPKVLMDLSAAGDAANRDTGDAGGGAAGAGGGDKPQRSLDQEPLLAARWEGSQFCWLVGLIFYCFVCFVAVQCVVCHSVGCLGARGRGSSVACLLDRLSLFRAPACQPECGQGGGWA